MLTANLHRLCFGLSMCALLTLTACNRGPNLVRLAPDAVVLAFGDSLTFGTGASPDTAYPAQLQTRIGRKVVNAGVPGEVSAAGLARLPTVLDEVKPALLILCHGGNDFLQGRDEGQAAANLRGMVKLAQDQGIGVLLIATPRAKLMGGVPPFYAEIASETRIPLDDNTLRSILTDNNLKSDLVHPNATGYAQLATAVEQLLRKSGGV